LVYIREWGDNCGTVEGMTDETPQQETETSEANLGDKIEAGAQRLSDIPVVKAVNDEIDKIDHFVDNVIHRHGHD
jgi:hypothetical protein